MSCHCDIRMKFIYLRDRSCTLLPQVRAFTLYFSLFSLIISKDWVPIDPVLPKIEIVFIISAFLFSLIQGQSANIYEKYAIIYQRRCKKNAVEPVKDTAVSGNKITVILDSHLTFKS